FEEVPIHTLYEFLLYQREAFPFNKEIYNQFDKNIIDFCDSAKDIAPELFCLALQLFEICINSASVERLWSTIVPIRSQNDNEDFVQELEKSTVSDNKICSPTTDNLPKDIVDETKTFDEKENWSNIIENWVEMLNSKNRLENGEIVDDELPEFKFGGCTTHPADDSLAK
ncbi:15197_t:CDS:2, partial [Racocetra persica]